LATEQFVFSVVKNNNGAFRLEQIRDENGNLISITGGGYVGVSFRPESSVLSIGTPHFAMSPVLMEWGLNQLSRENWFIRLDKDADKEIEGGKRLELYQTAMALSAKHAIGIDSSGGYFRPEHIQEMQEVSASPFRPTKVSRAIGRAIQSAHVPQRGYVVGNEKGRQIAAKKIKETAINAVYAYPGGLQKLRERATKAARKKAEKISGRLRNKRRNKRRADQVEDLKAGLDEAKERIRNLEDRVRERDDKIERLEGENGRLEDELKKAERQPSKIEVVKALAEKAGVHVQEAYAVFHSLKADVPMKEAWEKFAPSK
jgi:hypothetical protein